MKQKTKSLKVPEESLPFVSVLGLTSVRGSSASRFAAGIWSSLGLLEDEDEDEDDDVVCSEEIKPTQCKVRG